MKAFIDTAAHPRADDFYLRSPLEPVQPTGTLSVGTPISRLPNMTLDRLLTGLATLPSGSDALIVSHGASGGLTIPFTPGSGYAGLGLDALAVFAGHASGSTTASQGAEALGVSAAQFNGLITKARNVRQRSLGTIVLRACNLGTRPDVLEGLRGFFGSRAVCAPDTYDSYAQVNPGSPTRDPGAWSGWLAQFPGARVYESTSGRFALFTEPTGTGFRTNAMADSWDAVRAWLASRIAIGGSIRGPFPIHCFQEDPLLNNTRLIFPLEASYRMHLHRVQR